MKTNKQNRLHVVNRRQLNDVKQRTTKLFKFWYMIRKHEKKKTKSSFTVVIILGLLIIDGLTLLFQYIYSKVRIGNTFFWLLIDSHIKFQNFH